MTHVYKNIQWNDKIFKKMNQFLGYRRNIPPFIFSLYAHVTAVRKKIRNRTLLWNGLYVIISYELCSMPYNIDQRRDVAMLCFFSFVFNIESETENDGRRLLKKGTEMYLQ